MVDPAKKMSPAESTLNYSGSIFQYKIIDPASIWLEFGRSGGYSVEYPRSDEFLPCFQVTDTGVYNIMTPL